MTYNLFHPKEDLQGNQKENIVVVTTEKGDYIGSGYVYPKLTPVITPEHPLNIYLEMHLPEELLNESIGLRLFQALVKRAETLSKIQTKPCYLYSGAKEEDHLMLNYLKSKGYTQSYDSYLMLKKVPVEYYELPNQYDFILTDHVNEEMEEVIMNYHNKIFINSINHEQFHELSHKKDFRNLSVYDQHELIANMMVYTEADDDIHVGKIENFFVLPKYQKKGIGKLCLKAAYNFFNSRFIKDITLEVWSANTKALDFYVKEGFEIIKSTEFYNGKFI